MYQSENELERIQKEFDNHEFMPKAHLNIQLKDENQEIFNDKRKKTKQNKSKILIHQTFIVRIFDLGFFVAII